MKNKKQLMLVCLASLLMILLSGCVPGDGSYTDENRAGFFWGIWHGWLAPVSLIMGIFNNQLRVYETLNTGWWYDLGFYMAIISGFGSLSFFRKKETKKNY
ncbi:hypothetical protein GIY11_09910 [Aerococcaceae bacterium DSM 109653]|uniref:Lipoprotein n=1 Tax=Fundicoccus ignavus TaxID=2664442 RepID=A0A6I2GGT2_9LACT|nr:hypothetical protein [Fundicoccus ignavus]MRI82322.1 hypothetical protein [Fundicoccus ignavus]MRI85042.1 hypothetical protein [Fundicoccus ignavus]